MISELKKPAKYTPSLIKEEWMKPQLMDTVAKEIMFANSILFVEGQEDVGLIRKWLAENRRGTTLNIFGHGAGGFQKIEKLLAMAKDLRIGRVAVLYDSGASESEAIAKARKKFLREKKDLDSFSCLPKTSETRTDAPNATKNAIASAKETDLGVVLISRGI